MNPVDVILLTTILTMLLGVGSFAWAFCRIAGANEDPDPAPSR